jgi:uncharacterized protein YjiS (DUF1127 family)
MKLRSADLLLSSDDIDDRAFRQLRGAALLLALLSRVVFAIQKELRAHRADAELASLDDRMLRDIGVSRTEIRGLLRRPLRASKPHEYP